MQSAQASSALTRDSFTQESWISVFHADCFMSVVDLSRCFLRVLVVALALLFFHFNVLVLSKILSVRKFVNMYLVSRFLVWGA